MQVIFYFKEIKEDLTKRFHQDLIESVQTKDRKICNSTGELEKHLRKPGLQSALIVLLAAESKDLEEIVSLKKLLGNFRIILILPNRDPETVKKGHSLYPRFLSYVDEDFTNLSSILKKMMKADQGDFK